MLARLLLSYLTHAFHVASELLIVPFKELKKTGTFAHRFVEESASPDGQELASHEHARWPRSVCIPSQNRVTWKAKGMKS